MPLVVKIRGIFLPFSMKTNDLLATAGETLAYAEDYLETRLKLVKLQLAERGSLAAADLIAIGVVATFGLFALAAFSFGLAFAIGNYLNSYAWGFTIVGLIYTIFAILLFVLRRVFLIRPILKQLVYFLFKSNSDVNG